MTDTVEDLRSKLLTSAYGEASDAAYGLYPLQRRQILRLYRNMTGEELGEDVGIGEARYRLLEAVGRDPDPFECGSPFTKEELEAIWQEVND